MEEVCKAVEMEGTSGKENIREGPGTAQSLAFLRNEATVTNDH